MQILHWKAFRMTGRARGEQTMMGGARGLDSTGQPAARRSTRRQPAYELKDVVRRQSSRRQTNNPVILNAFQ